MSIDLGTEAPEILVGGAETARLTRMLRHGPVLVGFVVLSLMLCIGVGAPLLGTVDPTAISPGERLRPLTAAHWLGTDSFGRDVYSRVIFGARISLSVGFGAALFSVTLGMLIGLVAGYFRSLDGIIMRAMDGVMAIPGILLAIALVALSRASLMTVLIAISLPEIPRVVRLVRS